MRLVSVRDLFGTNATLSTVTIDGKGGFVALEDRDRGLTLGMPAAERRRLTVEGETAISAGLYEIGIRFSPSQGREVLYLKGVPGNREGVILLHAGNVPAHTRGCVLVATQRNEETMTISHSTEAVRWFEHHPEGPMVAIRAGRLVTIEITRDPVAWATAPGHP
jgi:hypothetical protein